VGGYCRVKTRFTQFVWFFSGHQFVSAMPGWGMAALLSGHRDLLEGKCHPRPRLWTGMGARRPRRFSRFIYLFGIKRARPCYSKNNITIIMIDTIILKYNSNNNKNNNINVNVPQVCSNDECSIKWPLVQPQGRIYLWLSLFEFQ